MNDCLKNDIAFWQNVAYFWTTEIVSDSTEPLCKYEISKNCASPMARIKQELKEDDLDEEEDSFEDEFFSRL